MEWKTQTSNSEFVKSDDGSSTRNKTLLLISYTDKVEKCKKKNAYKSQQKRLETSDQFFFLETLKIGQR